MEGWTGRTFTYESRLRLITQHSKSEYHLVIMISFIKFNIIEYHFHIILKTDYKNVLFWARGRGRVRGWNGLIALPFISIGKQDFSLRSEQIKPPVY